MKKSKFYNNVSKYFDFLEDLGYVKVYKASNLCEFITYSNNLYKIELSYGPAEWKVDLSFEVIELKMSSDFVSFGLNDIVALDEFHNWFDSRKFKNDNTSDSIEGTCKIISRLLIDFLNYVKNDGNSVFYKMRDFAKDRLKRNTHIEMLEETRKEAELAWLAKNYFKTYELYLLFFDDLTELEIKRLEYSKKQIIDSQSEENDMKI